MRNYRHALLTGVLLVLLLTAGGIWLNVGSAWAAGDYVVLGWNDLGMHCYNNDFRDMAILPPYNTLWAQVVKRGDPPSVVMTGITVRYQFPGNTYSVGKTNFWTYAEPLFGVALPNNIGLTGNGLKGIMKPAGDHFVATGIPLTEYSDKALTTRQPFQLATIIVKDSATGLVLGKQSVVAPVSSEMRCDRCHSDRGSGNPAIASGRVGTNILKLHDRREGTTLMSQRPVLCAECHADNALGAAGDPAVSNMSNAMHASHSGVVATNMSGCYNCHPGPTTRCLRDVMSVEEGMNCLNCHGPIQQVAKNPNPWLNEPRCDTCHDQALNQPLYRFSTGHGGLYCEACHDSTHAIAPSRVARDGIKFQNLQGEPGPLSQCTVCHVNMPATGLSAQSMLDLHKTFVEK